MKQTHPLVIALAAIGTVAVIVAVANHLNSTQPKRIQKTALNKVGELLENGYYQVLNGVGQGIGSAQMTTQPRA